MKKYTKFVNKNCIKIKRLDICYLTFFYYIRRTVEYLDPEKVYLVMDDCRLMNQKGTAEKIYNGGYKMVCAWIECSDIKVIEDNIQDHEVGEKVCYNPRVTPNWVIDGENGDKMTIGDLITKGETVFKLK